MNAERGEGTREWARELQVSMHTHTEHTHHAGYTSGMAMSVLVACYPKPTKPPVDHM